MFQVTEPFLNAGCGCVQETWDCYGAGWGLDQQATWELGEVQIPRPHLATCTWSSGVGRGGPSDPHQRNWDLSHCSLLS